MGRCRLPLPGWFLSGMDLINAKFDMGQQFDERTAGSIFGSMADARTYFGADVIRLFAANLQPGADREQLMKDLQKQLGERDMQAVMSGRSRKPWRRHSGICCCWWRSSHLGHADRIARRHQYIMASIRTRRWQLGVLRSIGLTQSQLIRLIFSEALLVGVVACRPGLHRRRVDVNRCPSAWVHDDGFNIPISVAWNYVGAGALIVMSVAVIAPHGRRSAWPKPSRCFCCKVAKHVIGNAE